MAFEDRKAMSSAYKAQIAKYGTPISEEQYRELRKYADENKIKISGFRNFVGDVETIKTVIDDICEIAFDFPAILDDRKGIILELDYDMRDEDFATTDSGHVIHINAGLFSDRNKLESEYLASVKDGDFVAGTDWRAICRHETGHVVEYFGSITNFM